MKTDEKLLANFELCLSLGWNNLFHMFGGRFIQRLNGKPDRPEI